MAQFYYSVEDEMADDILRQEALAKLPKSSLNYNPNELSELNARPDANNYFKENPLSGNNKIEPRAIFSILNQKTKNMEGGRKRAAKNVTTKRPAAKKTATATTKKPAAKKATTTKRPAAKKTGAAAKKATTTKRPAAKKAK
jgi:hypothetical protein